jgi:hypothetical protein
MWMANRTAVRVGVATVAAGVLAAAGHAGYGFRTLDNNAD